MPLFPRFITICAALLALVSSVNALETRPKPSVWIAPPAVNNGSGLRELFEHPDDWKETRALTDVLFYTDLNFKKQFSEDELHDWFGKLRDWTFTRSVRDFARKFVKREN